MDIRHNGHFYRTPTKTVATVATPLEILGEPSDFVPDNASAKILLTAYKNLILHFNQLSLRAQKNWQLEVSIVARQLTHLFKQMSKGSSYRGYPAINLLKEIRQLDTQLSCTKVKATVTIN